jgi:DNA invertase Pin-like site-specific DNA recombinase
VFDGFFGMAGVVTIVHLERAQEALEQARQEGAPPGRLAVLEQAVAGLIALLRQQGISSIFSRTVTDF